MMDRRTFLKAGGAGLAGIVFSPVVSGCSDDPVAPAPSTGYAPFITPNEQFYVQHGGRDTIPGWRMPDLSSSSWSMKITGEVFEPMTLTMEDIRSAARAGEEGTIAATSS